MLAKVGRSGFNPGMTDNVILFDRPAVRRHRDRAARIAGDHDFLHREVSARLNDRLNDVRREFDIAVNLGGGQSMPALGRRLTVTSDLSLRMLARAGHDTAVVADEEFLPFGNATVDLVASCLSLHWVNDLPGALVQIRRALKPDGLFLAAILGGDTLIELRRAFLEAESETTGGTRPHTSPVADVADAGALLQRAGFALPVVDSETLTVTYSDMFALMRDLRGMGETNAVAARNRGFLRRDTLFAAAARYQELYADEEGRIPATFQIITMTGWAPHDAQPRALRPGSAAARLSDALDSEEKPTGDKTTPKG